MDLGRGPHCVFAFEGVVIFGLQEVPAERVNGPFLVKPERASSEAFGAHVLCGESLPHVRRHAELCDSTVQVGVGGGEATSLARWTVYEQRRVFRDHDGKMERWKLKKRYVCYDEFNGILDLAVVVMVQNQLIRTGR